MKKYERIYREVAKIPEGTVATYGQIAERVGCGPREVGQGTVGIASLYILSLASGHQRTGNGIHPQWKSHGTSRPGNPP